MTKRTTKPPREPLTGKRFGRLFAGEEFQSKGDRFIRYRCKCDCGAETTSRRCHLLSGEAKSCGCLGREASSLRKRTHGLSNTDVYNIWYLMTNRCKDPKNKRWEDYGGRGIKVDPRWMTFENFRKDMGVRPSKQHSLDRIDNNGNYEPINCRWATKEEQATNKRNCIYLHHEGSTLTISQWSRRVGISSSLIWHRLDIGWSVERTLTENPKKETKITKECITMMGKISDEKIAKLFGASKALVGKTRRKMGIKSVRQIAGAQ